MLSWVKRHLFASLGHGNMESDLHIFTYKLIFWYHENFQLYLPEAVSPRFTTDQCFFPALTDRHCLRSHYFSYKYTKLVSVLGLMLQLLTVTLVSAADSYSLHKNLCQSAYVCAGRLSSSLWEPKSTSHAGTQACTHTALNITTNDTISLSKASKRALLFHRIMYVDFSEDDLHIVF